MVESQWSDYESTHLILLSRTVHKDTERPFSLHSWLCPSLPIEHRRYAAEPIALCIDVDDSYSHVSIWHDDPNTTVGEASALVLIHACISFIKV